LRGMGFVKPFDAPDFRDTWVAIHSFGYWINETFTNKVNQGTVSRK
jgi:hypothetical protein